MLFRILLLLFIFISEIAFAQTPDNSKIYTTLIKIYPNVHAKQIRVLPGQFDIKAFFTYHGSKYTASFDLNDTALVVINIRHTTPFPDSITADLKTRVGNFTPFSWTECIRYKEVYNRWYSVMITRGEESDAGYIQADYDTTFHFISGPELRYNTENEPLNYADFDPCYYRKTSPLVRWYGGSKKNFADSISKYTLPGAEIAREYSHEKYAIHLLLDPQGKIQELNVYGLPPLDFRDPLLSYLKSIPYQPSVETVNGKEIPIETCIKINIFIINSERRMIISIE